MYSIAIKILAVFGIISSGLLRPRTIQSAPTKSIVLQASDTIPELMIPKYQNRRNEVQDSIWVNTDNVMLLAWDQGIIDGDEIQITQFQFLNNRIVKDDMRCRLKLVKKKQPCRIRIDEKTDTYLRMDALDMGSAPAYNSAFFKISSHKKKAKKDYILYADDKKSAVFKLIYDPGLEDALDERTIKILDTLTVVDEETDGIFIYKEGQVETRLLVNGLDAGFKSKAQKTDLYLPIFSYARLTTENFLRFRRPKNAKWNVSKLTLYLKKRNRTEKVLELEIDDATEYVLPVNLMPNKEPDIKEIFVHTTQLKMQLSDDSKEDGDRLTITQDNFPIISNYTLRIKPQELNINIKPNTSNVFNFKNVSFSSNVINTARIVITDLNDRVLESFRMSSYTKIPAKLIITHVSENDP